MDIKDFEFIKEDFVNRFIKRYGVENKDIILERTDKIRYMQFPPKPGAAASYHAGVLKDYGLNNDVESQIIVNHELNHAISENFNLEGIYNYKKGEMDTSGFGKYAFANIPQEYYDFISKDPDLYKVLIMESGYFENRDLCEYLNEYININMNLDRLSKGTMVFKDGSYVSNNFLGSYYDSGLNLFGTLSSIIGEDKIVSLQLGNISLSEIMKDFDTKYKDALNEDETKKFNTPMIKILYNMNNIFENLDSEEYKSVLNTLHKAYEIKLNNLDITNAEDLEKTYKEIKNMQNMMLFSVPQEKMENEDYIKSMKRIEEKFIQKVNSLEINEDKKQYIDNISYKNVIPISKDDSNRLSKMINASNNPSLEDDKSKLYRSLFNAYKLCGDSLYNHSDEMQDMLISIEELDSAKSKEEYINLYNKIGEQAKTNMSKFMSDENLKSKFSVSKFENIKKQIGIIKNSAYVDKNGECLGYDSKIEEIFNSKLKDYKKYNETRSREYIESLDKSYIKCIERLNNEIVEDNEKIEGILFEDRSKQNTFLEGLKEKVNNSEEIAKSQNNNDYSKVVAEEGRLK